VSAAASVGAAARRAKLDILPEITGSPASFSGADRTPPEIHRVIAETTR